MRSVGWPKPENDPTSLYKAMPDMQVVLAGLLKQLGARYDDSKEMHIFMTVPLTFINFLPTLIILVLLATLLLFLNNKFKINQGEVISNVLPYIKHSIGYYSVALTFLFNLKNILTPVWTVIVYSHESPPKFKTIVEINAFSGGIVTEPYSENLNA